MATYNWSYRPNLSNKYGIVIADSADDVKPDNATYVALFGNDTNGNGSRLKPYRTLEKGYQSTDNNNYLIIGSGIFREAIVPPNDLRNVYLVGDGEVKIDTSYFLDNHYVISSRRLSAYHIHFIGNGKQSIGWNNDDNDLEGSLNDCILEGVMPAVYAHRFSLNYRSIIMIGCTVKDIPLAFGYHNNSYFSKNNTWTRCNVGFGTSSTNTNDIFSECNINFEQTIDIGCRYSLFHKCNFGFNAPYPTSQFYPGIPEGYEFILDLEELRIKILSQFPNSMNVLSNCRIADPKFNNLNIGDFSLAFDSPAKNMSYFGTHIGAQSVGYPIKANAAGGDFDLSTNTNLIFSDNSIVLANPTSEGSIESNVIANITGRELSSAPVFGFYADRNGQYLDATEDLSAATISVGDNLISNTPYVVENAAVTYNGAVIQPGERFTTTDVLSFASVSNGTCREILEAPQRHTILARFSDGGTVLTSGTAMAVGAWYYANGTVNYEGVTYTNQVFKAISTNPFTGSGNVILAMADESYQLFEPGIKFTSNNAGNTRTGAIIRGNGDPLYERGLEKEFPINAKFIQFRYIIKVNNLKP